MCDQRLIQASHKHLGRPWNANGFDCWECVRAIYSDAFGIVLPVVPVSLRDPLAYRWMIETGANGGAWEAIDAPVDGCVVALGRREWPHHVGVYLSENSGRVVHCLETAGCCVDSVAMLRRSGWGYMRFYKLVTAP